MGGGGGGSGGGGGYRPDLNGYFGRPGNQDKSLVRHLPGGVEGARRFYENITRGYVSQKVYDDGAVVRKMADGTNITFRTTSSTDGTAAIDINRGTMFHKQKIHFMDY